MQQSLSLTWSLLAILCASTALAQDEAELPTQRDFLQTAVDLRAAAESLAQFGESLERVAEPIAKALVEISANHAAMSREFDPLGVKAGHRTVQAQLQIILEQQRAIQRLQAAEIRRLRKELNTRERRQPKSRRQTPAPST